MGFDQARGHGHSERRFSLNPPKGRGWKRPLDPGEVQDISRRQGTSVKPLLMQIAVDAAARRGYQALRITDITDPANVTRQAFYAHFRDKRHCLCEALDPHLAAIERLAASTDILENRQDLLAAADRDLLRSGGCLSSEWTAEIVATIDELLIEHFGSGEGTKGRLMESLAAELEMADNLSGIRIGSIVKRARVPQGDFYRHFSGKRECFAALYEDRLDALIQGVRIEAAALAPGSRPGLDEVLLALGTELEADPGRARLLILGEGELPEAADQHLAGARRGDLGHVIARLLPGAREDLRPLLAGALIEVIRSAVIAEGLDGVTSELLRAAASIDADRRAPRATLVA